MAERAHIYEGDRTTANGIVADGIDGTGYHDRRMAYIGAPVTCPACATTGRIGRNGECFEQDWYGKTPALENDFCLCACHPPPTLIASQHDWTVG
jgi:uncharacterized Zn-binding protein involved in type VI secretion